MREHPRETVIAGVAQGLTVAEAARRAGTTRNTVNTWRRRDPVFRGRLAAARQHAGYLSSELPTRHELLARLDEHSRAGNLGATMVLFREMGR